MDKHFEKAVEDGKDPSPKDIHQLQQVICKHQIAFFVDNTQASDRVVKNLVALAKKNDVPVLKVTETKPSQKMIYTKWMMNQYQELSKIQKEIMVQIENKGSWKKYRSAPMLFPASFCLRFINFI